MEIKIGADELILWLRKNKKAEGIPNDGINGLGVHICRLIERLSGEKDNDIEAYWDTKSGHNIGQMNLPKTATQYKIETSKLCDLYKSLNELQS